MRHLDSASLFFFSVLRGLRPSCCRLIHFVWTSSRKKSNNVYFPGKIVKLTETHSFLHYRVMLS